MTAFVIPAFRSLRRRLYPAKGMRVRIRDITFEVPGPDADQVADPVQFADVLCFHNGSLVLRNCHVRGAVAITVRLGEGVLVVQGMAGTVVRYEPPEMVA